jgi:hypothetical protein
MTTTDPSRVDDLLAQYPGPVRLTPSPGKWLLFIAGSVAFMALIWFFLLRPGGVSLYTMAGWLVIALFAFNIIGALGNLLPGVAYLKLDADGFETKTLFGAKTVPWKIVSNFRAEGSNVSRRVAYDVFTNEPPRSALFNFLINRQRGLADNYGVPHEDLARLMNEWRAKAVGGSAP